MVGHRKEAEQWFYKQEKGVTKMKGTLSRRDQCCHLEIAKGFGSVHVSGDLPETGEDGGKSAVTERVPFLQEWQDGSRACGRVERWATGLSQL